MADDDSNTSGALSPFEFCSGIINAAHQKDRETIMELYRDAVQSHDAAQQDLQDRAATIEIVIMYAVPENDLELIRSQIAFGNLSRP